MALSRVLCSTLVGREPELSRLEDALLSALRGDGGVMIVGGEAGRPSGQDQARQRPRGEGPPAGLRRGFEQVKLELKGFAEPVGGLPAGGRGRGACLCLRTRKTGH